MRKKRTLIVVAGLERSGKMPLARLLASQGPDRFIVSRDSLRSAVETPIPEQALTLLARHVAQFFLIYDWIPIVVGWNLERWDRVVFEGLAAEQMADLRWLDTREPSVAAMVPPLGWVPPSQGHSAEWVRT